MINKDLIRKQIKKTILDLTIQQQNIASHQMTELTLSYLNKINSIINVACYWPTKLEISTIKLINTLLKKHKNCYLPLINQDNNQITFIQYTTKSTLIKNKFGILEPSSGAIITSNELDLIFMPLVAFDSFGHRIGSGSGFYDKSLAHIKLNRSKIPLLIGLAYSIQEITNFTPDPWDINLDCIITEKTKIIPNTSYNNNWLSRWQ